MLACSCAHTSFHPHYDGRCVSSFLPTNWFMLIAWERFANKILTYDDQKSNLSLLVESYLSTMRDLGAETWIMHGTLMGWWWNRQVGLQSLECSCSIWVFLELALGFGCRCSSVGAYHSFPGQLLQHDHTQIQREKLHVGDQPAICEWLSSGFVKYDRWKVYRYGQGVIYWYDDCETQGG